MSGPDHGHGTAAHGAEEGHGSLTTYLIGFGLSVVLTALPFWLVMTNALHDAPATIVAVVLMAMAQIVVHIVCFLHVSRSAEGGWTLVSLVFTAVVLLIMVVGSLWIMYHLNSNMMPMAAQAGGAM